MFNLRAIRLSKRLTLRKSFYALFALLSAVGLSACTKYLGDAKRTQTHMKVQSQMSCFNQVGETLSDYVAGKVPLAQMDALLDCTNNSVDEFTQKVVGSTGRANSYTQSDITVFLDQYLLTSGKFDHQLLSMLFDLKASSVSGDTKSISPDDIKKLKALLVDIKLSMHEVDPYLGLLTRRETIDPHSATDGKRFDAAIVAFRSAIDRLAPYFAPSNLRQKTFTMDEGFDLLASLGLDMKKYQPYKDLSRIGKQVLVGGTPDVISAAEWLPLIKRAVDGYAIYLRYQAYISPLPLIEPAVTPQLHSILNDGLAFVSKSITMQDQQVVTEAQMQQMVRGLDAAGLLPKQLTADAIIAFLPIVIEKWLLDRTVASPVSSHGIGLPEFNTISVYSQNWMAGLDLLDQVSPDSKITQAQLSEALRAPGTVASATSATQKDVLSEWTQIFAQGRPWSWNNAHYVNFAPARILPPILREDLFRMNIWRLVGEAVLRTYAKDPQRSKTMAGLTVDEVQNVYLDIRNISNDMRLIDPRSFDAGSRTFMETNLFTSAANGDNLMQYREAVDWINNAISSTAQGTAIYTNIEKRCAPTAENDLQGHRRMDDACFRSELRKGFAGYFPNFPNLVSFFKTSLQDDKSWTAFITAFETMARPEGPIPGPIDIGAARALVTVIGYNESLFLRFDVDQNQLLTDSELWTAFPLVQPLIQSAMAKPIVAAFTRGQCLPPVTTPAPAPSAVWLQKAVFAYLIRNGTPPPASGLGSLFVPWAYAQSYVLSAKLNRADLIKILASFTAVTNQKNTAAIGDFYKSQQATYRADLESGVCSVVAKTLALFKCDPSAHDGLVKMARAQGARIFMGANETPDEFTKAMEQQLQNDPVMRGICLPF